MNLRDNIKKILNETSGKLALQMEKLLNRQVKERYKNFVCRIEIIAPGNESFYASGEKTKRYIVRVIFKKLPRGGWVARDYEEKVLNECWDLVYNFMNIPVDVYSKNDPNCDEDLMLAINETELTERCWKGYTQKGMKTMFGKRYPNCVKKTKK
jgi:hypothetical protein